MFYTIDQNNSGVIIYYLDGRKEIVKLKGEL